MLRLLWLRHLLLPAKKEEKGERTTARYGNEVAEGAKPKAGTREPTAAYCCLG
jgi:hypothetical protein